MGNVLKGGSIFPCMIMGSKLTYGRSAWEHSLGI